MKPAQRRFNSLLAAGACCALVACSEDKNDEVEPEPPQPSLEVLNAVAVVGDEALGVEELRDYLASRPSQHAAPLTEAAFKQSLEELLSAEVLYQEARRLKLDQTPAMRRTLRQMLGQQLLEREVRQRVLARPVTDEELKAYFAQHRGEFAWPEQIRLADIFIAVAAGATDEEKTTKEMLAEQILAQAIGRTGDRFSFSELISEHSDKHPGYALGDTGFFDREGAPAGLSKALAQAAFSLQRNGQLHAGVIETAQGFHVIMRVGHKAAQQRDFREVKSALLQRIQREALQQERRSYIDGLREQANIRINSANVTKLMTDVQGQRKVGAARAAGSAKSDTKSSTPLLPR